MGETVATHVEPDHQRQLDIISPRVLHDLPITVIGAGGIGSPSVVAMAKMGCATITVYDHDVVEVHNLPSQWFRRQDVDRPKVAALAEIVRDFTGVEITARPEKYTGQPLRGVVIAAVDHMDTRRMIWEAQRERMAVKYHLDGRMGGEQFEIYAIPPCDPDAIARYERTLFPQSEAADLPCTARAVIYNTLEIGAEMAQLVKRIAALGTAQGGRPVPFFTAKDFTTQTVEYAAL